MIDPFIMTGNISEASAGTPKFFGQHLRRCVGDPVWQQRVLNSDDAPLSGTMTNSTVGVGNERGIPAGKYQRSPSFTSATSGRPFWSSSVTRQFP